LVWGESVEIVLPTATARTDLRATYGGIDFAVGLYLAWCSLDPRRYGPGLALSAAALAGFVGGRLVGWAQEGRLSLLLTLLLVFEAAGTALCAFLCRRLPSPTA
jgi:hypothetical protein